MALLPSAQSRTLPPLLRAPFSRKRPAMLLRLLRLSSSPLQCDSAAPSPLRRAQSNPQGGGDVAGCRRAQSNGQTRAPGATRSRHRALQPPQRQSNGKAPRGLQAAAGLEGHACCGGAGRRAGSRAGSKASRQDECMHGGWQAGKASQQESRVGAGKEQRGDGGRRGAPHMCPQPSVSNGGSRFFCRRWDSRWRSVAARPYRDVCAQCMAHILATVLAVQQRLKRRPQPPGEGMPTWPGSWSGPGSGSGSCEEGCGEVKRMLCWMALCKEPRLAGNRTWECRRGPTSGKAAC